jgi:hypothetical protein
MWNSGLHVHLVQSQFERQAARRRMDRRRTNPLSRHAANNQTPSRGTANLERFPNSCALCGAAKGVFSLREKALESYGFGVQQLWNRYSPQLLKCGHEYICHPCISE